MKFRTDFVTNSSDSSFLAFNIKNKSLYNALKNLGITIEDTNEGEFKEFMTITLPSGEQAELEYGENNLLPYPSAYSSISSWLVGCILWEIEDVYPQKEEDEYSDFAHELIDLLNEANITHLDWEAVSEWSRDDVILDLDDAFSKYDNDLTEGEIEYTYGFEGETGPNEVVEIKNGRRVFYSFCSDYDEEENEIDGVKFALVGKWEHFETKEEFIEFIEDLGGSYSSTVTSKTDFVICNDEESTTKAIEKAKELNIPIITESAFLYRYANDEFEDIPQIEDFDDDLWATTHSGGFKDIANQYGVGSTKIQIWKDGKWQ